MKRQRNVDAENTKGELGAAASRTRSATMEKKKRKEVVEKVEEERKNGGESSPGIMESYLTSLEDLPWLSEIFVDEQMSWGSTWLPFWDVDYMGEACSQMFSDDVWDYDIWNLRTTN